MKVLQINSVCGIGSTGRIAVDLYKVLKSQGHECKIAYGRGNAPKDINTIKIGNKIDNYWHVFKTRVFDKHGFGSINATKKFIKKIKEYDPDIIHLHNIHGYYINIEILFNFLKEFDKPVVWTLHDCWAFTGHCSHFDYIGCDKWKTLCFDCPQKEDYPSSKFIDNSKLNFLNKEKIFTSIDNMVIVTPSKWLANLVKQSFLSKYNVNVINNGINLEIFRPRVSDFRKKYNLEGKFIILGVASIWSEKKGLKYFIELSKIIDSNCNIVLVGVDKKFRNKIPENIIIIERTNDLNELVEIYSCANVFLNPTLEDNFPTTNIEALACGIPVITFDTGGSVESIDESCGLIVRKNENIHEIIDKISCLNIDFKSCVLKSRKYSSIDQFKKYIDLYRIYINNKEIL